jgi:hypothetical protein
LGLEYIGLAPGFVREVIDVYEAWQGKEAMPLRVKQLMLNLRIEVDRRYKPNIRFQEPGKSKIKILTDTRLDRNFRQ